MAPTKDFEFHEESAEGGSNSTTFTAGSSSEQNESAGSSTSIPAILELSEDDPLFNREKIKLPLKTYKSIMRSFNSTEIYANSDEPSNDGEYGQPMSVRRSFCFNIFNHYKNLALKITSSKLIYIVQMLLVLLPFSAISMGFKYSESCPGSPSLTVLTVLTGMFALLLIVQWMAIKCCSPEDRPCEGQQKCLIMIFFLLVAAMLQLEIYLYSKLSPSFEKSTTNYCSKTFYDFTYYKFLAAFGSMFFVVLLYFPDYRSIASGIVCSDPLAASCYRGYLEEDD